MRIAQRDGNIVGTVVAFYAVAKGEVMVDELSPLPKKIACAERIREGLARLIDHDVGNFPRAFA